MSCRYIYCLLWKKEGFFFLGETVSVVLKVQLKIWGWNLELQGYLPETPTDEVTSDAGSKAIKAGWIDVRDHWGPFFFLFYSYLGSTTHGHLRSRQLRKLCWWFWYLSGWYYCLLCFMITVSFDRNGDCIYAINEAQTSLATHTGMKTSLRVVWLWVCVFKPVIQHFTEFGRKTGAPTFPEIEQRDSCLLKITLNCWSYLKVILADKYQVWFWQSAEHKKYVFCRLDIEHLFFFFFFFDSPQLEIQETQPPMYILMRENI